MCSPQKGGGVLDTSAFPTTCCIGQCTSLSMTRCKTHVNLSWNRPDNVHLVRIKREWHCPGLYFIRRIQEISCRLSLCNTNQISVENIWNWQFSREGACRWYLYLTGCKITVNLSWNCPWKSGGGIRPPLEPAFEQSCRHSGRTSDFAVILYGNRRWSEFPTLR